MCWNLECIVCYVCLRRVWFLKRNFCKFMNLLTAYLLTFWSAEILVNHMHSKRSVVLVCVIEASIVMLFSIDIIALIMIDLLSWFYQPTVSSFCWNCWTYWRQHCHLCMVFSIFCASLLTWQFWGTSLSGFVVFWCLCFISKFNHFNVNASQVIFV